MSKVRLGIAAVVVAGLLVSATARASDAGDWNSFVWVDTWSTSSARAVVVLDPDAPVVDVVFESDSCVVGPMVELEPGYWVGEGPPQSAWHCWYATFTVFLNEAKGGDLPCPFVGLDRVTLTGNAYTDSYDSSAGPYAPGSAGDSGHVCSNGRIRMTGNAAIHGDAHPGPGQRVTRSGNATVTGYAEPLHEPIQPSPVDPGAAVISNDNLEIPFTDRWRYPLNKRGEFRLSSRDSVALAPGTYFFTSLKLSGRSSLRILGKTVIYVAKEFDASGGSITGAEPGDLEIRVMGERVKLTGHSDLYARVYAPNAVIERTGGSDFYGSLVGRELRLTGNGGLHADASRATSVETSFTLEWVFDE